MEEKNNKKYKSRTFWIVIYQLVMVPFLAIIDKLPGEVTACLIAINALWGTVKWKQKRNGGKNE